MPVPMPEIVDIRGLVARQPVARFARRALSDIKGVVFHQVLGDLDALAVARYHTSTACHIAPGKGCPSICYTYFVAKDGTIQWCNDLESVTWSQGSGTPPIPNTKNNTNFLAVVFQGDFTGPGHAGTSEPTPAQLASASTLWRWLREIFSLPDENLFGHHDFGKPACPGDVLAAHIKMLRDEPGLLAAVTPNTVEEWQKALVLLGYDLGKGGSNGDGVDGDWGKVSQAALVAFQTAGGFPRMGSRDVVTARNLATALSAKGITSLGLGKRRRR